MQQKIIEIADDLNPHQEVLAIAKALAPKKSLKGNKQMIGNTLGVRLMEETIIIKRVSKVKPEKLLDCSCGVQFVESAGKYYYTNYGGSIRKVMVCSSECKAYRLAMFGDRVSATRSGLKQLRFF